MRDFLPAIELFAKAVRSGLGAVGALVDCGIPRQHAGAQWLTAFEEENEVLEVPLSADFTDEAACECWWVDPSLWTTHYGAVEPGSQMEWNPDCPAHPPYKTPAAGANGSAVEDPPGGAPPPPGADSLTWVAIAIPVIAGVLAEHIPNWCASGVQCFRDDDRAVCAELADWTDWHDHVAPHIADRLEAVTLALPEEA